MVVSFLHCDGEADAAKHVVVEHFEFVLAEAGHKGDGEQGVVSTRGQMFLISMISFRAGCGGDVGVEGDGLGRRRFVEVHQAGGRAMVALSVTAAGSFAVAMAVGGVSPVGGRDERAVSQGRHDHFAAQDGLGRFLDRAEPLGIVCVSLSPSRLCC